MTWTTTDDMQKETLALIQEAVNCGFLSIAAELQNKHIGVLQSLLERLASYKKEAQAQKRESDANTACVMQSYVKGVSLFLSMWVLLKQNKWIKAWDALVEAQNE